MAEFDIEDDFWDEKEDMAEWVKEMSELPEKPDRDPWTEPEKSGSGRRVSSKRKRGEERKRSEAVSSASELEARETLDRITENYKEEARSRVAAVAKESGLEARYWVKGEDATEEEAFAEIERIVRNSEWCPADGGVTIGLAHRPGEGVKSDRLYEDYANFMADMSAPLSDLTEQWNKMADYLTLNMVGGGCATHEDFHTIRKRSMVKWLMMTLLRMNVRPTMEKCRALKVDSAEDGLCEYDKCGPLRLCPYGECSCEDEDGDEGDGGDEPWWVTSLRRKFAARGSHL